MTATTPKNYATLIEAAAQVLDDMGPDGKSCCLAAKADLRIALDPFLSDEDRFGLMTLEAAMMIRESR